MYEVCKTPHTGSTPVRASIILPRHDAAKTLAKSLLAMGLGPDSAVEISAKLAADLYVSEHGITRQSGLAPSGSDADSTQTPSRSQKRPCLYDASIEAFRIELTQGKEALVSPVDIPEVGRFNWCALTIKGKTYAMRKSGKEAVYLHRVIAQRASGSLALGCDVDHANGDTLDCRRDNLRICTRRQNNLNRIGYGASKHKGVDRVGDRWRARINGRHLGLFATEEEAALAHNRAAAKEHGEFARLNDVGL